MQVTVRYLLILSIYFGTVFAKWKIINGTETVRHEYPEIVSIRYLGDHICGGTLLNSNTVLTAAHCVFDIRDISPKWLESRKAQIVVGEHDVESTEGDEQVFPITEIILPSSYNYEKAFLKGNDIALLKFKGSVSDKSVSHIKYAKYAKVNTVKPGDRCELVGWGSTTGDGENMSRYLLKATLKIISGKECSKSFYTVEDYPSKFCAGNGVERTAACGGDSGGPLFCKNEFNENVQVGIVSYSKNPCGQPNVPTVFTNVAELAPWIAKNL